MGFDPRLQLVQDDAPTGRAVATTPDLPRPVCFRLERSGLDRGGEARYDPEVGPTAEDAPAGASIFAISRRGELRWCTPSAHRDLKQIGARHPRRPGRVSPEWAYHLWNPIHVHRLEYQIAPLDSDALPCRGRVAWSPARPDELTASIWRLRAPSSEADPTWRRLIQQLRGVEPSGGRPAA